MDSPSKKLDNRLESIDFLRGVAALAVVFTHSIGLGGTSLPTQSWFQTLFAAVKYGWIGVPLFFVISGFCIHAPYAKKLARDGRASVEFFPFWKRRFRRLYPPYFVMLCIGMATMVLAVMRGQGDLYPDPKSLWLVYDFVAHALMLHGFHPILDQAGGVPPMWTLAREEYLYLMYFALLAWRRARGILWAIIGAQLAGWLFVGAMFFVLPAPAGLPDDPTNWWVLTWRLVNSSALALWIEWALGMLAAEYYFGLIELPAWCRRPWASALAFGVALIAMQWLPYIVPLCLGLTFFILANWCIEIEKEGRWPRLKIVSWLTGVGVFSYSLYLTHNMVIRVLDFAMRNPPAILSRNPWVYLVAVFALVAVCVCVGKAFFWLVERHFLNTKPRPGLKEPVFAAMSNGHDTLALETNAESRETTRIKR